MIRPASATPKSIAAVAVVAPPISDPSTTLRWIRALRLVLLLSTLTAARPALAQDDSADPLDELRGSFRRLDYEVVDALSSELIEDAELLSIDQLVEVHVLAGLAHFYRGHETEARAQFESALSLDQNLTLNLRQASPDALAFFNVVREDFLRSRPVDPAPGAVRYVIVHDDRPAAAVRSFLIPGWGQLYKGQRTKGVALVTLWAATAGGGVAAHIIHAEARDAYEEAGPADVLSRYDTMNRWHKLRKGLAIGAAVVWAISAVDAVVSGGPAPRGTSEGLTVTLIGPDSALGMQWRMRF